MPLTPTLFFVRSNNPSNAKENILLILLSGFFIGLYIPHSPVISNVFMAFLFVSHFWLYKSGLKNKYLLLTRPAILIMISFFLLHLVSLFFTHNLQQGIKVILLRISLLIFPVTLGGLYISRELRNKVLLLYSVITILASVVCLVHALIAYVRYQDSSLLYNDWLSDAIGMQSVYFALMVTIAIIFLLYSLLVENFLHPYRMITITCIAFLLLIHYLLACRSLLIFFYGSISIITVYYFLVHKKQIFPGLSILAALCTILFSLIVFFPKTMNRFNEFRYPHYAFKNTGMQSHYNMPVTPSQWNGVNTRFALWACGWELFRKSPVTGTSVGDNRDALAKLYRTYHFRLALENNLNLHNNYFDVLVTFGITGFLLFIAGFFILPLKLCIEKKDFLGAMIVMAMAVALFTETYYDRRIGCIVFAFFISFIVSYNSTPSSARE